jgi:hypothetical protein
VELSIVEARQCGTDTLTVMSEPNASEQVPENAPPRRTSGRIFGAIVLTLAGIGLLVGGIQAIADPGAVVAGSSSRKMDSDVEAKLGGLILCMFGITVLGFGISLFAKKKPGSSMFGPKPE